MHLSQRLKSDHWKAIAVLSTAALLVWACSLLWPAKVGTVLALLPSIGMVLGLLSAIVLAHELGHFLACRLTNRAVSHFTVGFGPRWLTLHWQWGEVEYRIAPILAGGECRIVGMNNDQEKNRAAFEKLQNENRSAAALARLSDETRWYANAAPGTKALVAFMGPFFSVLIAFPLFAVGFYCAGAVADVTAPAVVAEIDDGGSAAGLMPGDKIVSLDGVETPSQIDFYLALVENGSETIAVSVERSGEQITVQVTPNRSGQVPDIGMTPEPVAREIGSLTDAAAESVRQGAVFSELQVRVMGDLFSGKLSPDALAGPVGIVKMGSGVARQSTAGLLVFFGVITIALGLTNLLPIPCLDGGHILFAGIEAVIRRPIPHKVKSRLELVGALFLFSVLAVITLQDLGLIRLSSLL